MQYVQHVFDISRNVTEIQWLPQIVQLGSVPAESNFKSFTVHLTVAINLKF